MIEYLKLVIELIKAGWPILAAMAGLVYKQYNINNKVLSIETEQQKLALIIKENQEDLKGVRSELHDAIKEQGVQTNAAIQKLTEATSELVISTKVMASQLEFMKEAKFEK